MSHSRICFCIFVPSGTHSDFDPWSCSMRGKPTPARTMKSGSTTRQQTGSRKRVTASPQLSIILPRSVIGTGEHVTASARCVSLSAMMTPATMKARMPHTIRIHAHKCSSSMCP